jgi:TonB family protein
MPSLGAGSGPAYANYAQAVKSIYERNWYPPDDTSSSQATVSIRVTITRDGNVKSAIIIRRSGDGPVDGSIENTLRRVNFIKPFPAGSTDKERTYIINFNLEARRSL